MAAILLQPQCVKPADRLYYHIFFKTKTPSKFDIVEYTRKQRGAIFHRPPLQTASLMYEEYYSSSIDALTHWGLVMPYDDIELGQHWLR